MDRRHGEPASPVSPESLIGKIPSNWEWGLFGPLKGFLVNFRGAPHCVSRKKPWHLGRPFAETCARSLAGHLGTRAVSPAGGMDVMRVSLPLGCNVKTRRFMLCNGGQVKVMHKVIDFTRVVCRAKSQRSTGSPELGRRWWAIEFAPEALH